MLAILLSQISHKGCTEHAKFLPSDKGRTVPSDIASSAQRKIIYVRAPLHYLVRFLSIVQKPIFRSNSCEAPGSSASRDIGVVLARQLELGWSQDRSQGGVGGLKGLN